MKNPLISVIVPVYKVEKYLNRCVKSIVNQTYRNLEIILVDDGSQDCCPAICDAWAEKDGRVKVIHKENGGLSDARNAGVKVSRGELIGFVDSDDWISIDMYQCLYEAMKEDNSDVVACGVEMVWEDGTPSRMLTKIGNCVLSKEEAMRAIIEESWLKQPVWYKLYKMELVRDISFPVGKYHEDVFWSYQVIGRANQVSVIDRTGYYYWQRSGSIMGEKYSIRRLDAVEAYGIRFEYITKKYPTLEKKALVALWESCIYNGQMALRFLKCKERKKALLYLRKQLKQHPISSADYCDQRYTHRIWLSIARVSLLGICVIKNCLNIGD